MECKSEGNPNPSYTWKYNLQDLLSDGKYSFSADKSELSITITNITDTGNYQCMASINFKRQLFTSSSSVTLTVQEKSNGAYMFELEKTCIEISCSTVQNCVVQNGRAFCSVNIWIVIAILFIIITFILCATTLSFILLSRTQRLKTLNNSEEIDMGWVKTKLKCLNILMQGYNYTTMYMYTHLDNLYSISKNNKWNS